MLSGSLSAQTIDTALNVTIQGKAGKMIVFKSLGGLSEFVLSRNSKFLMGRSGGSEDSEDNMGIIYEIATEKYEITPSSVIEVIDWDNYVTTTYAKIGGKEYTEFRDLVPQTIKLAIEEASADLLTLRAGLYLTRSGADWSNILIETKTGKILDTLKDLDPTFPLGAKMTMGWKMSADTKIIGGRASLTGGGINYTPAVWDRDRDTVYFVGYTYKDNNGKDLFTAGEMWDVNAAGTLLCGSIREKACILKYNRETGERDISYIDYFPGYDHALAYRMSGNGLIVGYEQMGIDINSRRPYIYDMNHDEKYILAEYLQELYGLNAERDMALFTTTGISEDGRLISGYNSQDGVWFSYLILLDEHQVYAPVRNVQVQAVPRRSSNIEVSWREPMKGEYTLTGYKIFRDKEEIGSVPSTELSFRETDVPNGKHRYFVQAVYGDKVSDAVDTVSIFVVDPNGCLPVQEIFSNVEYNSTVSLFWGLPSDQETMNIINRPKGHTPKYTPQEGLDFVSVFQPVASRLSTSVRVNDYVYSGSYASGGIFVYDLFGNTVKEISINGVGSIYDMTYRNGTFYVATGNERINMLSLNPDDPFDISLSGQFTAARKVFSITYVENDNESINNGEDYLIAGDYYNLVGYPYNATGPDNEFKLPMDFDISGMIVPGTEYYKGRLYLTNQNGTNGCDVVAYDMATGKKLFTTDLYAHPTVVDASNNPQNRPQAVYAGGLAHSVLADGTVVLECLLQCQFTNNMMVDMELESSDDVLGYVIYRNGKKVSDTLTSRHFTEDIDEAGTYTYHVEYLSVRGCSSSSEDMDVTCQVDIFDKGKCSAPAKFNVYESNKNAVLSWSAECFNNGNFVGFNLYRNGERIGEKRFIDLNYTDSEVELGTEYEYRLEAFYNTSCVASDTVKITLNGKGAAREPGGFSVKGTEKDAQTVNAKATWTLPYFEEPMAYGYCGLPVSTDYIKETQQVFCIVGWNHEDMDKFDDDLYLVGVEFVMGMPSSAKAFKALNTIVYVDDDLVYNEPYEERFPAKEWIRVYFDKVFKMKQNSEIAVGYSISYNPSAIGNEEGTFVFDMGPRKVKGKSDLIALDGKDFGTLQAVSKGAYDVNFCINALVVHLRDLEAAALAADPKEYLMHKTMRMDLKAQLGGEQKLTDAPKTTSEGIKLLGFNIYRDGKKLNENLMTKLTYEENVAHGEYKYEVGAVYEGADELKTEPLFINFANVGIEDLEQAYGVSVYPNPASDVLNIKGNYVSFMLVDMNGRVLMRDVRNTESVSLAGLNEGVYFMLITLPNGDKRSVKVIKR